MYNFTHLCIFLIFTTSMSAFSSPEEIYSTYRIRIINYTECQTSRMHDSPFQFNTSWLRLPNGTDVIRATGALNKTLGPLGFRIRLSRLNPISKQYILLLDHRLKNICDGFITEEITRIIPVLNSKRCTIEKGTHSTAVENFDRFMHLLSGEFFFLGTYRSQFDLTLGGASSVFCVRLLEQVSPKDV